MAFDSWGASWGGAFTRFVRWGAFEAATTPVYGPPFQDFSLELTTTIDRFHKMNRDLLAHFPSSRLDVDGESEP